jgi:DNA primase
MAMYKKESLELLRSRIDLVEVVSSHIRVQRSGASYKALCPFHEEKTPSFVMQKGDSHYHCFGCGAHGDAIAFLMGHLKMGFVESIESLAERFQVVLEKVDGPPEEKGPNRTALKNCLEKACQLYHFTLLHTQLGHKALHYLYERGIDLEFIQKFRIGYAPPYPDFLQRTLGEEEEILAQAGLLHIAESGRKKDFFSDRITFPISDATGAVIGFSCRKFKEETYGGKYINTPETPLFKKSSVLFGLSYSRMRIAKEKKALIVEGQIDALRLIHTGFDFAVAGQGTAFGEEHVKELIQLGVSHALLAMDGDEAGHKAAVKVGNLLQKKGVEVSIIPLPAGNDPDAFLRERGKEAFSKLLEQKIDYLTFLFQSLRRTLSLDSPAQKNELVKSIANQIRVWEQPIMVHESLKRLASMAHVPEEMVSELAAKQQNLPLQTQEKAPSTVSKVDPDRILETDLLRWLFFIGENQPELVGLIRANMQETELKFPLCKRFFSFYMQAFEEKKPRDLLTLGGELQTPEEQQFLSELMQKKINLQKAKEGVVETVRQILTRRWLQKREEIRVKIHSGSCSDEELLALAKEFDQIKKNPPEVKDVR